MILLGVTLSVVLTVAVGLVVSRKVKGDSENYLVAGRGLGATLTGAALMGQAVDANATLATPTSPRASASGRGQPCRWTWSSAWC